MNLEAYAKHRKARGLRGTSHVAVLKAIESGRLTEPAVRKVGGRWQIDALLADMQWAGNTNNLPEPSEHAGPPDTRQAHPADGGPSMAQAKRAKAVYEAELTRLALKKKSGEVGVIADMQAEAARIAIQVRDAMLALADRLPPVLAPITDQDGIEVVLLKEIEDALRSLN